MRAAVVTGTGDDEVTTVHDPTAGPRDQEITITGSMAVLGSHERAVNRSAAGVLDPEMFTSHRLPLEEFGKGIHMVINGVGRKIQLQPSS